MCTLELFDKGKYKSRNLRNIKTKTIVMSVFDYFCY